MFRALQRITRNGNSSTLTIPRALMTYLDWRVGDPITIEVQPDRTLKIRPPVAADLQRPPARAIVQQTPEGADL